MTTPEHIPEFLRRRPADDPVNHLDYSRASYQAELERTSTAIKIIDLRMENTEEEITKLQRQQADDRRELGELVIAQRAAKRALAELDGVR